SWSFSKSFADDVEQGFAGHGCVLPESSAHTVMAALMIQATAGDLTMACSTPAAPSRRLLSVSSTPTRIASASSFDALLLLVWISSRSWPLISPRRRRALGSCSFIARLSAKKGREQAHLPKAGSGTGLARRRSREGPAWE